MNRRTLVACALTLTACAACRPAAPPPPPAEEQRPYTATGEVAGLTLPNPGEVFTIGGEKWEVEAATVTIPTAGVQQDTQIIDVTIQARRARAQAPEYLGPGEERPTTGGTGAVGGTGATGQRRAAGGTGAR